jgi:hypothetical protein
LPFFGVSPTSSSADSNAARTSSAGSGVTPASSWAGFEAARLSSAGFEATLSSSVGSEAARTSSAGFVDAAVGPGLGLSLLGGIGLGGMRPFSFVEQNSLKAQHPSRTRTVPSQNSSLNRRPLTTRALFLPRYLFDTEPMNFGRKPLELPRLRTEKHP